MVRGYVILLLAPGASAVKGRLVDVHSKRDLGLALLYRARTIQLGIELTKSVEGE